MRLSDLKTGDQGVVVKVQGHGAFRKRIIEMGFVRGKIVTVLLNAPLKDPIKYKIMDYEVSLRRSEASLIEVVTLAEIGLVDVAGNDQLLLEEEAVERAVSSSGKNINIALVGNPNSGKTSLFNFASI